jgi:uncharacterized membrane protein YdbT with pleckstrin-like domain
MSYIRKVLQPDERIVYQTRISWTTYIPGLLILVAALVLFLLLRAMIPSPPWIAYTVGLIVLLVSLYFLVGEWFEWWTTEIAITNTRVVLKRGFIRRDTAEMHMDKVESVDVNQSLFGRLLNFGDVTVHGTGTGLETLRQIDNPLEFRNNVKTHDHATQPSQ